MASTSETGHAKNVSHFDELISFVTGYETAYNPSKTSIKLPALQALSASAKTAITAVNAAIPAYKNASAAREVAFEPLRTLLTRVLNALKASDTTPQVNDNARTFVRKIQGERAKPKLSPEKKDALSAEGKEIKEISSSQLSYDNKLDNFDKLIKLLNSTPQYAPNEVELKTTTLISMYSDLVAKNSAVVTALTPLSNSRISRDNILYKPNTGMVDIALHVKLYVKSLFGATSPQYRQISKLQFKSVKI